MNLACSSRTVRNVLQRNSNVRCAKLRQVHHLQNLKRSSDWNSIKKDISFGSRWKDVVFSDENQVNLDVPDGFQHSWYDFLKDKPFFFPKQNSKAVL